ncbi:hypothetical protein [Saccharomonospora sp. NB11]|jgi:hypothetical protein|uniref:hypothetical protein n=1 Tax=Saccharomonospora sp. NB11 TaxID=1642298 RepID=UPI0018D18C73|nr:hypothetical protein [Saccharomonospora sp. NB11]
MIDDIEVLCHACGGEGRRPEAKVSTLGGVPHTATVSLPCSWCEGVGRREGIDPPA